MNIGIFATISTDEIIMELAQRGTLFLCRCHKWATYIGSYDADGYTLRCHGCLKAVKHCTCT